MEENASTSASVMKSTSKPSVKIFVTSEEGINLFVDMNMSSFDWSKRLQSGVCTCQFIQENKFQSFREELLYLANNSKHIKSSFLWSTNSNTGLNGGTSTLDSSPHSFDKTNDDLSFNRLDTEEGSLEIFARAPCKFSQEVYEHSEQGENAADGSESTLNDQYLKLSDELSVNVETIASCSMEISAADGSESTLNDQNLKLCDEISMNVNMEKGWNLENDIPFPVSSSISAIEMQSDNGNLQKDAISAKIVGGESVKSSVIDHNSHFNSSCTEEQVRGSPVNGKEASFRLENKVEKSRADGGCKRKRNSSQSVKVYREYSQGILRSSNRYSRQAHLRRSQRLASK